MHNFIMSEFVRRIFDWPPNIHNNAIQFLRFCISIQIFSFAIIS